MLEVVRAERKKLAREQAEERARRAAEAAAEEERRAAEQRALAAEEERRAAERRRRLEEERRRAEAQAAHVASLRKWEYRVEVVESPQGGSWQLFPKAEVAALQKRLTALGAEGWELVAYGPSPLAFGRSGPTVPDHFAFFKREAIREG
ncbi:MAG TPA: hypothetical protein VFA19_06655 [Gaiellaceae bacterium]|nr:hypothetical protein [Gaiellaceae bacterium]